MAELEASEITRLLNRLGAGEATAAADLMPVVYAELKKLAAGQMVGQRGDHTLQPTGLVHEAWVRIVDRTNLDEMSFGCRAQFFSMASKVMRSVLVDHARQRNADKRFGKRDRMPLADDMAVGERSEVDLLALDDALERLTAVDPELTRIVEMRFFGGLTNGEIAEALGKSLRTVERSWRLARAWLHGELAT